MIKIPNHISLANLPTKIEKLHSDRHQLNNVNLYIKRDDQTGTEYSGNKIRKLEFVVQTAIEKGCDTLITCGGIQSNHARATAAVAARLGMKSILVLRSNGEEAPEGNYFLDMLFGAEIIKITPEAYKTRRGEIMEEIKQQQAAKGFKAYIIPEGASDGIGAFGYFKAMEEIMKQEEELGLKFDAIVSTVGSGGTFGGLFLAGKLLNPSAKIYGINICDDAEYFKKRIYSTLQESLTHLETTASFTLEDINIIDGYAGGGYGLNSPSELQFISDFARKEGIVLDPVYTGKAMYGLMEELRQGNLSNHRNILFIHTGGLYGLFPKSSLFSELV